MEILIIIVCLIVGVIILGNIIDYNDKKKSEKAYADETAKARLNMHNHVYLSKGESYDGWCLVKLGDFRFAFVNSNGQYLGNFLFTNATPFKNGTAIVSLIGRGYCIIRSDGSFALSPEKEQNVERYIKPLFGDYYLLSRRFPIKKDTVYYKYYIVKRDGTVLTKTPFDKYLDFEDGIFRVQTGSLISEISESGSLLNPPFRKKIEIGKGLFKVMQEEYRWGIYDSNTKQIIIPCRYSEISYVPLFDHFILKTYKEDNPSCKSYVIDRNGNQIVPPLYSDISVYGNKFYHIGNFRSEGTGLLCGLCDIKGNVLIQPNFQDIWIGDTGFMVSSRNGRCGIVNHAGFSALEYDSYKCVYLSTWDFPVTHNSSDFKGNPQSVAYKCHPTYLIVCKNNKYGVVNVSGKIVLPLEYDSIKDCEDDNNKPSCYIIQKGTKFGVANLSGQIVVPIEYEEIEDKMDVGTSIYTPLHHLGADSTIEQDMEEINHYDEYCRGKARYFILYKNGVKSIVTQNNVSFIPQKTREELIKERYIEKNSKTSSIAPYNKNNTIASSSSISEECKGTQYQKQEYILFFDTETTGLPADYNAPASDTSNWPRLVQLSWILTDNTFNIIEKQDLIIRPEGFKIPSSVSRLHGITTERALIEGISLNEALNKFKQDLLKSSLCVGHNISFDKKIIASELFRLNLPDFLSSKKSVCTMRTTVDLCKIPGKFGYKYPKLQELYKVLFGLTFEDAHNAMSDVSATVKCFIELRKRHIL